MLRFGLYIDVCIIDPFEHAEHAASVNQLRIAKDLVCGQHKFSKIEIPKPNTDQTGQVT